METKKCKRYEYKGKIWSDEDLEDKIDNYGGDIFDLGYELKFDGVIYEECLYYIDGSIGYDSYHDLIDEEIDNLYGYVEEIKND